MRLRDAAWWAAVVLAVLLLALPLVAATPAIVGLFVAGVLALAVAVRLRGHSAGTWAATLVAVVAVAEVAIAAVARPHAWGLANTGVEALALLAFLTLADRPWDRADVPILAGAVVLTAGVLVVAAVSVPASVWLVLVGMLAAVVALALARWAPPLR